MKNFFSEMDNVMLTFSDIQVNGDGMEFIKIYFERPTFCDFDYLESELPSLIVKKAHGFTLSEQEELLDYAQKCAFLIWDVAHEKVGVGNA